MRPISFDPKTLRLRRYAAARFGDLGDLAPEEVTVRDVQTWLAEIADLARGTQLLLRPSTTPGL